MPSSHLRSQLITALASSDERVRGDRADRIIWMGQFEQGVAFMSYADTAAVWSEAKACFVDGHHIATQLLALSFAEHVLHERLLEKHLLKRRMTLARMIHVAKREQVVEHSLLDELDRLRKLRNPYVHLEAGERTPGLGERVRLEGRHPRSLLEQDARAAIRLLYGFFGVWLGGA